MKRVFFLSFVVFTYLFVFACNKKSTSLDEETILKGRATILVDETILPVIEDQVEVFESQYNADITLIGKSESEIIKLLSENKQQIAILTRDLTKGEAKIFEASKIKGKVTSLAADGIAFISNKNNNDTIINIENVIALMQGKESKFKGLVFDNPNSSTVRYLKELSKVKDLPKDKIFSFKTNNEVIQFVSKNEGMIGVVGVNWLYQPMPDMVKTVGDVNVLSVKVLNSDKTSKPTQDNIAGGLYPLTREIKMLNYQGKTGLGMGFASFVAGEIGQRIILKSGLVPVRMPGRNIIIRKEIENKENNK